MGYEGFPGTEKSERLPQGTPQKFEDLLREEITQNRKAGQYAQGPVGGSSEAVDLLQYILDFHCFLSSRGEWCSPPVQDGTGSQEPLHHRQAATDAEGLACDEIRLR